MTKWILGLVILFWIGLQSSQSVIDLMDFVLVLFALILAFKNQDLKKLFTGFRPAWLWLLWLPIVILSFVFGAPVEFTTAAKLVFEFRWILGFLSYIYLFQKLEWQDRQVRWLSLVLLLFSIIDLIAFFVNYDKDPRAGGLFGHSMPFAHTIGPSALFLLFYGIKKFKDQSQKPGWRGIYLLAPLMATVMMALTLTRGVWLGYTVALLICATLFSWRALAGSILALAVAGGIMVATSHRMQDRVMGKTNAETQSNDERLWYWKENFKIFRDYPYFGIGYSQNNVHVEEYLRRDGITWMGGAHAHNQHIHFLAGTGIGGVLCFWIFLGAIFSKIGLQILRLRNLKRFDDYYYLLVGSLAALICFAVGSLTESNFSISKNRYLFLFIAAFAYAICERIKLASADRK